MRPGFFVSPFRFLSSFRGAGQRVRPLAGPMTGSASESGIHNHRRDWIPGLRQEAHPRMTEAELNQPRSRSEEHTSELQSLTNLVCRLLLEKKKQPETCRRC